jgi:hypothetical protein
LRLQESRWRCGHERQKAAHLHAPPLSASS